MNNGIHNFTVASPEDMAEWPVDRKRSGEKLWAETTWGGDAPNRPKLFNWNIWPCRAVLEVTQRSGTARAEIFWRRSARFIRMKGLKLLSAKDNTEIADARTVEFSQEKIVFDFNPLHGPGTYHLYYGSAEPCLFKPSPEWETTATSTATPPPAKVIKIEARCQLDSFYPMEVIALKKEVDALLAKHRTAQYLVFTEDRHMPVKLTREIPAHWATGGPPSNFSFTADKNEYRVFQVAVWACRSKIPDLDISFSGLSGKNNGTSAPGRFKGSLCVTLL